MDRQFVYAASIPQDTDILLTNRHAMVGLGYLAMDLLGSGTVATGLACTATSPASLVVQIAPGRLYSLQNVDNTAYGSLASDTAHQILKQGILADAFTIPCAAPATFGFSINYLIQASYQDSDTNAVALPYYNSSNPAVPYSGPTNNGLAQATRRKGVISLSAKPGTPAATGTQATPAPDSGYVGLYVVTVANGATTITSANITLASSAPFLNSFFPVRLSGPFSTPVSANVGYNKIGKQVTLNFPWVTGASNASGTTLITAPVGSIPAFLVPSNAVSTFASGEATGEYFAMLGNGITAGGSVGQGNQSSELIKVAIDSAGAVTFFKPTNFPTSPGVNGFSPFSLTYLAAA